MHITPPFGYQEILPLRKEHRVLMPMGGKVPPGLRALHLVPLSLAEFGHAGRHYPIVFVGGADGGRWAAAALLGLEPGKNLFLMADHTWDRRVYVPAYVRRYPFCMATVTVDGELRPERVICVEKSAVRPRGDHLFDAEGNPVPVWQTQQKLLVDYEADVGRAGACCRMLEELGLLETFTVTARPVDGPPIELGGMSRVADARLAQLEGDGLRELMQRGYLAAVYAHLFSLENFQKLLDRRAALAEKTAPREGRVPGSNR